MAQMRATAATKIEVKIACVATDASQLLTGVSKRCAAHYCQRHDTCCSRHPGVDAGARRHDAKGTAKHTNRKPKRQEQDSPICRESRAAARGIVRLPAHRPEYGSGA